MTKIFQNENYTKYTNIYLKKIFLIHIKFSIYPIIEKPFLKKSEW